MEYVLTLRAVNEFDLSSRLRFIPDDEEVETCLQGIEGELNALECLVSVKRKRAFFYLSSRPNFDIEQLRTELKPILSGSVTEIVRFVSFE